MEAEELMGLKLWDYITNFFNNSNDYTKKKLTDEYMAVLKRDPDFNKEIERYFANDSDINLIILSTLFHISPDKALLDQAERAIVRTSYGLDLKQTLRLQLNYGRFAFDGMRNTYEKERKFNSYFTGLYREAFGSAGEFIPYEERNKNRIFIFNNQLRGENHAPSKIVYETYFTLKVKLGFDVELYTLENEVDRDILKIWYDPKAEIHNGNTNLMSYAYNGIRIPYFRMHVGTEDKSDINYLTNYIRLMKPLCIFDMGHPEMGNYFTDETCVVGFSFGSNMSASEAQVIVSPNRDNLEEYRIEKDFCEGHGQHVYDSNKVSYNVNAGKAIPRQELGLHEDDFVITVVGNRLNDEITDEFKSIMEKCAAISPRVKFAIIGNVDRNKYPDKFNAFTYFLGFRPDLTDVLAAADLYMNPKRSGGGFSSLAALKNGLPVITLDHCDVASWAGDAFITDSVEDYPELVNKYVTDKDFYKDKHEKALEAAKLADSSTLDKEFMEKKFHAQKVMLTTSGTSALDMAMLLCGLHRGDEVILPSYTFSSTATAAVLAGAKLVFVDIRPDTMNIDEEKIEEAITEKTKVIIAMHYAGVGCDMDKIMDIARRHGLKVVEDAAQGVNAMYKDKYLGTIGDFGCYSFHETKNYSMSEGGAIVINNKAYNEKAEVLREEVLKDLKAAGTIDLPFIPDYDKHNAHMFYIKCKDLQERTALISYLKENGICAVFHYVPLRSRRIQIRQV